MTLNESMSAREREILNIVYRLERATATDVIAAMEQPPSRSAVRTFLRILEEKGHVKHIQVGKEYVFSPTKSREKVGRSAVAHILDTFFGGSLSNALASYLAMPGQKIDDAELARLEQLIESARRKDNES